MVKQERCSICKEVGSPQVRILKAGYASAESLGRPRGAKGADWYETETYCFHCGAVNPPFEEVIAPCYVCGKDNPDKEIDSWDLIPGYPNEIPGMPDRFNVHSGCEETARKWAHEFLSEAPEGWDE